MFLMSHLSTNHNAPWHLHLIKIQDRCFTNITQDSSFAPWYYYFLVNINWQAQKAFDDDFIVVMSYIKHII